MKIAYTAHTETCTLLLDGEGICRSVVASSGNSHGGRPSRIPSSAERCIGAQFVAALDLREAGGMVHLPRPGAQMLFARTENGRVTLVRSAPVVRFEAAPESIESGVHARPSADESLTTPMRTPTETRVPVLKPPASAQKAKPAPVPARAAKSPGASQPLPAFDFDDVDDEPTLADPLPPVLTPTHGTRASAIRTSVPPPSPSSAPTRVSAPPEAPSSAPTRTSAPPGPPRVSGVVPAAARVGRTLIPPPPAMPRVHSLDSETRPIVAVRPPPPARPNVPSVPTPRRPSVARVSAPELDNATLPFRRAAR